MINLFHKDYQNKLTTTFFPIDTTPLMAESSIRIIVKPNKSATKQKNGHLAKNRANK